jgi:hypothetical protein
MPDILRMLPTGGDYYEFKSNIPSGGTRVIGNIYLVQDTYAVAFAASVAAEQAASTTNTGGGIVGTSFNVAGTPIVYIYEAERIMLPKIVATGEAFVVGDDVWLNLATLTVSPNFVTGRLWVGTAQKAATDTATRVLASFEGTVNGNN